MIHEEFGSRFEREARAISSLNHPHICTLYDIGPNYLVMELVEGETLAARLKKGALPVDRVVRYGAQIADALAEAHARGIIHRDLKPGNIMVTRSGVKVLDFGLAKSQQDETITASRVAMGTPAYMAPEQRLGKECDTRTDIYALGLVLYEMAMGKRVTRGEPLALNGIPETLAHVIEGCLDNEPSERWQSASDIRKQLIGAGAPKTTAPPARVRLRTAIALAAVLAIPAVVGWFFWRNRAGQSINSLAVLPFVNAGGSPDAEYLSDGIPESLMNSLSELPNLKVMSRSAVFRYKGKEADPRVVGRDLGVRAVLTGRITQRGDKLSISAELVDVEEDSHLWGEQYNRKLADALAVQNDIAAQISDKLRLKLSSDQKTRLARRQTENPEAYQLYLKGRFFAAKFTPEGFEKGLDYFHQAIALDPHYALAYGGISYILALTDDVSVAPREVMPKAKEAALKAVELDDTLAEGHAELGSALFQYDYDWPAAERELRRAVELNPNYAPAHEFLGWFLVLMGRTGEGLDHNRRSVALDPLSLENAALLGWDLYFARHYDDAVAETRKAMDLDPECGFCYFILGQAYVQQGRFAEAIAAEQKAIERPGSMIPPLSELASAYALAGREAEAHQALADLLVSAKRQYVSKYAIAMVYAAMSDKDQALAHLEQAYRERSCWVTFLKVEPKVDNLRSDPRFQDLMRRMNFPP
jgi:serine/threonine-protein kinase